MEIPGRVQNGVVVLQGETKLPEGTPVTVVYPGVRIWRKPGKKNRVKFPLVRSEQPGTLDLTTSVLPKSWKQRTLPAFGTQYKSVHCTILS